MVKTLNGAVAAVSQDTARDTAGISTVMVREYGSSPVTTRPHPTIQADMLDEDGNLRAADIGITWEGNETFLHGVRVVGSNFPRPIMSTPYPQRRDSDRDNTSTTAQPPTPVTPVTTPDADARIRRFSPETRQGYRPAAPIQIQQQVIKLAGVVPTLPGGSWRPWLDQRTEGVAAGVIFGRNRHERSPGAGRQWII